MADCGKKMIFTGLYEHSVDDKGRVAVPSKLKKISDGAAITMLKVTRGPDNCLYCYTEEEWERVVSVLQSKVETLPFGTGKNRAFIRLFIGEAFSCTLDKIGRIAIPENLLKLAGINQNVVFVGSLDHIELWSKERWDEYFDKNNDNFEDYLDDIVKKG